VRGIGRIAVRWHRPLPGQSKTAPGAPCQRLVRRVRVRGQARTAAGYWQ
jgi:hypothetical protein